MKRIPVKVALNARATDWRGALRITTLLGPCPRNSFILDIGEGAFSATNTDGGHGEIICPRGKAVDYRRRIDSTDEQGRLQIARGQPSIDPKSDKIGR